MTFLRDNGLSIVLLVITLVLLAAMFWTGLNVFNDELAQHGQAPAGIWQYAVSGHFLSTVFENWESEFLEKAAYVVLTAYLFQRGSAESRDPDEHEKSGPQGDDDPVQGSSALQRSGRWLYAYSLGLVLAGIFLLTLLLHLTFSWEKANAEAALHGQPAEAYWAHLASANFWFESFQNWQSEFMSTGMLVVLSIFLRYRRSPESKQVNATNAQTGR